MLAGSIWWHYTVLCTFVDAVLWKWKIKILVYSYIYFLFYNVAQYRDSILKSIEKKLNSSDLNDYDLLMAASIYFNEQVC